MRITTFILLMLLSLSGWTQQVYTVTPVQGLNTTDDEILCGIFEGQPLFVRNDHQDLVNDYAWNTRKSFRLLVAQRGKSFLELGAPSRLLPFSGQRSEGTASFNPKDSCLYFSTSENYGRTTGNRLKIYRTKWDGKGWSSPEVLPFCEGPGDFAHPHFDPSLNVLVFSSNKPGGFGGMDIWYSYLTPQGWAVPVNPGLLVNTSGHEVFPTLFRGDLYFSSNGILPSRGYELFYCERKTQWKAAIQLPEPLNSAGDDMMICFLNEFRGFVSSNREGGAGGDDVYLFTREQFGLPPNTYSAELEVEGILYSGARVEVTNELKEVILDATTDNKGRISLQSLPFGQRLRLSVTGVNPLLYKECVLYLVDERGNRVRELRLNEYGWVELELLPLDYTEVELFPNTDKSWLSVTLDGRLQSPDPEGIREGEAITIVDDKQRPVAVAFAKKSGEFSFGSLTPDVSYTFRLAPASKAGQIVIMEKGQEIVLPVLREEAIYRRIADEEAIAIVNERDEVVYVAPDDLFVINRIYYGYASAEVTDEAKAQLDQLVWLMNRNLSLRIELNSHTDSRGSASANLNLSQQRAESAMTYLTSQGVNQSRISAHGRGETSLLNHCRDGAQCSEDEHAINRRTEIRFVGNDQKVIRH